MVLLVLLVCLSCAALVPLVLPLLRTGRPAADRGHFDRVVYRDQLRELDRDVARGMLTETEATSARLEIQRRLLAVDAMAAGTGAGRGGRSPVLASIVALFAAGGTVAVYSVLGAPGLPDTPFSAHAAMAAEAPNGASAPSPHDNPNGQHDMAKALATLAEKLKANPSDPEGWLLYARTAGSIKRWDQAVEGYHRAMALGRTDPQTQAGYGETLTLQADGIVTPAAHDAFTAALKAEPTNDVARYYMGLAAGQAGEPQKAIEEFQTLLGEIPEDSPMRDEIGKRIGEAAKAAGVPMPELAKGTPADDSDDAAMAQVANLPPDQQKAMIGLMVSKLADKLQADPNDPDGWMRLGRAYLVMNEPDKGADAYQHAVSLKPGDMNIRLLAVEGLLSNLKPDDALPTAAVAMLHQVEAISPDEPEMLWYLGVAAARDAHPDQAKQYWTRLLTKLPPTGQDADMVKKAMGSLKGT